MRCCCAYSAVIDSHSHHGGVTPRCSTPLRVGGRQRPSEPTAAQQQQRAGSEQQRARGHSPCHTPVHCPRVCVHRCCGGVRENEKWGRSSWSDPQSNPHSLIRTHAIATHTNKHAQQVRYSILSSTMVFVSMADLWSSRTNGSKVAEETTTFVDGCGCSCAALAIASA